MFDEANKVIEKCSEIETLSKEYYDARMVAAESKINLDRKMASKLKELKKARSNIGYEMALIHIQSDAIENGDQETIKDCEIYTRETERFKALERLISAKQTFVSAIQSIWKWVRGNE